MMISLAAYKQWKLYHIDIKIVFFYVDLKEEVYITQLQGFIKMRQEHLVCKVLKAHYKFKQVFKAWYEKINFFLKKQGFCNRKGNYNLNIVKNTKKILLFVIYVDDIFFIDGYLN